jgi:NagD protein
VEWLYEEDKKFLFLTNSSSRSPLELHEKLGRMGLDVREEHFYTSALATAKFISSQNEGCSAYVIGDPGLLFALHEEGITINEIDPDYVIVGETYNYNYETMCQAVHHVNNGAKLIGTNTDITGPSGRGIIPACRALVAPIEMSTGKQAYYVGKPNPLMMRTGLQLLGVHSQDAAMIGDRMDTDIIAGIETGLDTCLVLSGVTTMESKNDYPYQPRIILNGVGDIPGLREED